MYNNNNTSIYPEDMDDSAINPRLSERRTAIMPIPLQPIETFTCNCCKQNHDNITCAICKKKMCDNCVENNVCTLCLRSDSKQEDIRAYLKKHKRKWCCGW